jgi:DNA-binding NtrC family response regulator
VAQPNTPSSLALSTEQVFRQRRRAACADALEAILAAEFRIVRAGGRAAAFDVLANENVSVMITDFRKPGMTGVELCRRSQDLAPETFRIILTAYTTPTT